MKTNLSLAICRTKLQAYTLTKILLRKKETNILVYYIDDNFNKFNLDFIENLSSQANFKYEYIVKRNTVCDIIRLLSYFSFRRYHNFYISSVANGYISVIAGVIRFNNLITFDDGAASLELNSFVYNERKGKYRIVLSVLFPGSYTVKDFFIASSEHYSIFPERLYPIKNFFNNNVNISKFFFNRIEERKLNKDSLDVFLAPCYEECFEDSEYGFKKVIEYLDTLRTKSIIYIPHPRSSYPIPRGCLNSSLNESILTEEYITRMSFLYNIRLIGFGNTTQAFFIDSSIDVVILVSSSFKDKYKNSFFSTIESINYESID